MISNSGSDERKSYSGGQAGDQTGKEWAVINWYNRPWTEMYRHPSIKVGEKLAELARKAAENNCVGYDQAERTTYWHALKAAGYDPAQISVKCEADCSAGVAANVKAVGYLLGIDKLKGVSYDCYTGNLGAALVAAGFQRYTESKYLTSDAYLLPGDVLLYPYHHTAVNLDCGSKAVKPVAQDMWIHENGIWYRQKADGTYIRSQWSLINHHWYYFDADGRMLTGMQKINGEWFALMPEGDLEGACCISRSNGAMEPWNVG